MRFKWFLNFQSLSHPFNMSWCSGGTSKMFPSWDLYKITFFRKFAQNQWSTLHWNLLRFQVYFSTYWAPACVSFCPSNPFCVKPNTFGARENVEWLCYYIQTEIATKTKNGKFPACSITRNAPWFFFSFFLERTICRNLNCRNLQSILLLQVSKLYVTPILWGHIFFFLSHHISHTDRIVQLVPAHMLLGGFYTQTIE